MTDTVIQTRPSQRYAVRQPAAASSVARAIWACSGLNLALVIALLLVIFVVSERWWLGTVLVYVPRSPWAVPSLALMIAGLLWHRPSLWINTFALLLVLGPLMEFRSPWLADQVSVAPPTAVPLRIVSANVQAYQPNFADLMREITSHDPDIVCLQEARGEHALLKDAFPEWHHVHADYYWIGSRYPLKLVSKVETQPFERTTGLLVEVQTPQGPISVANIHLMTARRGLQDISPKAVITGEFATELDHFQMLRLAESGEVRQALVNQAGDAPLIVAGDFNTPSSSNLFQSVWGDLKSSYDLMGTGYGYTSPVKPHHYWLNNVAWARIDHILCSPEWTVRSCEIGRGAGSDHHLIAAELAR